MTKRTIKVDYLARVEGEGALHIKIDNNKVKEVSLKIFEPPRFFEALLEGRDFKEAPDITARICGICPVAYQMSAVHAMEQITAGPASPELRDLRRLLYCGEWIESHVLHIVMLHAPDFLGYDDGLSMAKDYPDLVKSALQLKKLGNEIVAILGGREIHPINVKVGGFYKIPEKKQFLALRDKLLVAQDECITLLKWVNSFPFLDFKQDYLFVALSHPQDYAMCEGQLRSNRGLNIAVNDYEKHFEEFHVKRSNALHSLMDGKHNYFVGPLARYNLNFNQLPDKVKLIIDECGIPHFINNPFKSIIARAVETLYAFGEAIRITEHFGNNPDSKAVGGVGLNRADLNRYPAENLELQVKSGTGMAITEAPRGILYHRYDIDDAGLIKSAKIVPPTSQNQRTIERDLENLIPQYIHFDDEKLKMVCEQAIRNYDPCISCATHFLDLKVERS